MALHRLLQQVITTTKHVSDAKTGKQKQDRKEPSYKKRGLTAGEVLLPGYTLRTTAWQSVSKKPEQFKLLSASDKSRIIARYNKGSPLFWYQADFMQAVLKSKGQEAVFTQKYKEHSAENPYKWEGLKQDKAVRLKTKIKSKSKKKVINIPRFGRTKPHHPQKLAFMKRKLRRAKKLLKQVRLLPYLTLFKKHDRSYHKVTLRGRRFWYRRVQGKKALHWKFSFLKNLVKGWRKVALIKGFRFSRSKFWGRTLTAISRHRVLKLRRFAWKRIFFRRRWYATRHVRYNRFVGQQLMRPRRSIHFYKWLPAIRRKVNIWQTVPTKKGKIRKLGLIGFSKRISYKKVLGDLITLGGQKNLLSYEPLKTGLKMKWRKLRRNLVFNKFWKGNTAVPMSMNFTALQLYSLYIDNLQEGVEKNVVVENVSVLQQAHASRLLQKYIQLLKVYYHTVYSRKVAKNIPASSALHWVREYLRLSGKTRRRTSLWNRYNRVSFHFKPKAKDKEKRGRKKKILFKAKILFDRLFKWLYLQPNARYSLSAPIHNQFVSDYLVRNQFLLKKKFKVKLLGRN